MKTFKKALAVLLSLMMLVSLFPTNLAFAEGASGTEIVEENFSVTETESSDVSSGTNSDVAETPATDFDYGICDGKVTIEGYHGSDTDIVIPSSIEEYPVTSIGNLAFEYCGGLTSITIPDGVTWIGDRAFYECSGLTSITIPDSVTSIGYGAFGHCSGLTSINVDGNNNYYSSQDGILFNKTKTEIICYPSGKTATSYTIPDSVTSIGDRAFDGCDGLTSITIPDSVTSIGESAFSGCSGLTSITIPDGVTSIGHDAFYKCSGLTSITIPDSVTNIGDRAFYECSGLTSITIPDGVTSIGDYAFYDCRGLTSITLSNSVTSIVDSAFHGCSGLTSITIPDSVTSIGNRVFYDCSGLTSITIPDSVTSIGDGAFEYCSGLTNITIPDSVTSIGVYAFHGCSRLTSITIPDSVTSIGVWAFWNCSGLTSITIPDSVTSIGEAAFYGCYNLEDIWYEGNNDDKQGITIHDSNDNLINATWHYNTCKNGEHSYSADCDAACNNCEWIRTASEHTYTDACDVDCNECSEVRVAPHYYENNDCNEPCSLCNGADTVRGHKVPSVAVTNDSEYPFALNDGIYSSVNHDDSSSATMILTGRGTATIDYKTSTESNYDELIITKNDVILVEASGESDWAQINVELNTGDIVRITYQKDGSVNNGEDTVYVKLSGFGNASLDELEAGCEDILCVNCNEVLLEGTGHSYSNDSDTVCDACGAIRKIFIKLDTSTKAVIENFGSAKFYFTPEESGNYIFYSNTDHDVVAYLCDTNGNRIMSDDNGGQDGNFRLNCNLTAGVDYYFDVYCYDSGSATFEVTLKKFESPVASVTVNPVVIFENSDGYFTSNELYNEETGEYYNSPEYYYYSNVHPRNYTITLKNGRTYNSEGFEWEGQWYYIGYGNDQNYNNRWTVGNTYTVEADIAGYNFTYTVEIVESPVASVTVEDIVCRENSDGWWNSTEIYNEETDSYEEVEYFVYDTYPRNCTITLKNGETYSYGFDWNDQWYGVNYTSYQYYDERWLPGNTYTVEANIAGYEFTYNVTIAEYTADENFEYLITDGGAIITDMFISDETVEIPSEIGGHAVIGVASLGGNGSVKNIVFPDSVKTIGDYVLESLWNLETVTFGSGIRNLKAEMFYYLSNLKSITVSENNEYFTTIDGVLFDKDVTKVIAYPVQKGNTYVVPDTVSDISIFSSGHYSSISISFSENNMYYVTIDGVTYTADMTKVLFCDKNKSGVYVMPETVTEIEGQAFDGCEYLTEVVVSPLVTEIVYFTFASCYNLENVDLPEGLISIDDSAFANTYSLNSIELPETLEEIGNSVFYNSGLESLKVPDSVKRIDSCAFFNTSISTLDLGNGIEEIYGSAFENTPLTALNIPSSLTYIGWNAFANTKITSLIIPDTVLELGGGAFRNCSLLSSVTIGKGLSEISGYLFENTALTCVEFPDNITSIGYSAFRNTPLTALNITPYIVSIDSGAFENTKISSLVIPDTLTWLGSYAFNDCTELKTLTIGSGLSEIGEGSFKNTGLTSVVFPENIKSIGANAFAFSKLNQVVFENPAVEIYASAFYNCPLKNLNLGTQMETIYANSFAGTDITEIVIPDSVTDIMYGAFMDCEELMDIEMPTSVMHLGKESFDNTAWYNTQANGNTYLNHIAYKYKGEMPENTHLGLRDGTIILADNAFEGQSGLTNVSLPDGLKRISEEAFKNCYNLESVYIPKSIEYIGYGAFDWCDNLTDIWYEGSEEDLRNISINYGNSMLDNATWHFNSTNAHVHNYERHLEDAHPHKVYMKCDSCCDSYYTGETDKLDGCLACNPAHTHEYSILKYDANSHWNECECGAVDEENVYGHGYTRYTDTQTHWLQCFCGHIVDIAPHAYDNNCDADCNECGEVRVPADHVYDDNCDADCNECGAIRVIEHTYDNNCDPDCNECGETRETADHIYDNDCDTLCNECGKFRLPFGPYAPTFVVESATGRIGDTVTIAIKTKNNPGITGLKLSIGYDSDVLEFVEGQQSDFNGMFSISPIENNPISIVWVDTVLMSEDGTIALLTFRIKDDAAIGETNITVSYNLEEVYGEDAESPVAFAMENGVVNVISYIPGDVNKDDVINNKDLALLLRFVSDWDVEIDELAADVNRDGIVNNVDLGILLRYLSDWDVELK